MSLIAKPFGALMLWLYNVTQNYGLAVILFALIVKIIVLPFMMKSKRGTIKMSRLAPKVKELEKRHGANKQKFNEEVQKLYYEEKVNPLGGCLWSLLPFPILIALYYAIREPLTTMMGLDSALIQEGGAIYNVLATLGFNFQTTGYEQIAMSQTISQNWDLFKDLGLGITQLDYSFLGIDLGAMPDYKFWNYNWSDTAALLPQLGLFLVPLLAAFFTYASTALTTKFNPAQQDPSAAGSMKTMNVVMPLMTLVFAFIMPAALGIYWIATSVFSTVQDIILNIYYNKKLDAEDAVRNAERIKREAELEAKRRETEKLRAENATVQNPSTSKRKQQIQQRQEQAEKASEWERRNNPDKDQPANPSQVGTRRYARGRAYDPERYAAGGEVPADTAVEDDAAVNEAPESVQDEAGEN